MKSLRLGLWLILILCTSNFIFSQSPQESLIGKWQLINTSGGITGKGFAVKKKTVVVFTSDCKYISYLQDSIQYVETYYIKKSTPEYGRRDSVDILLIGSGSLRSYKFSLHKNRLILREPYPDGFTRVYIRELRKTLPK